MNYSHLIAASLTACLTTSGFAAKAPQYRVLAVTTSNADFRAAMTKALPLPPVGWIPSDGVAGNLKYSPYSAVGGLSLVELSTLQRSLKAGAIKDVTADGPLSVSAEEGSAENLRLNLMWRFGQRTSRGSVEVFGPSALCVAYVDPTTADGYRLFIISRSE